MGILPTLVHAALGRGLVRTAGPKTSATPLAEGTGAERRKHVGENYAACLGVLLVAYLVIYGWLLLSTNYFPYVMDNNESFSSFWHASNIYNFGVDQSVGLADESFSPHAEAHPYVHTHQGNFPRVFAFLIYVLGARTIELQIAFTTLTIGVAAIFFAYEFFSKLASPRFALIVCLVFVSDYIFYAQWNVVTYRVWHAFFVFSSLLCIRGVGTPRRRMWLALIFANSLALFYFEYVFVIFVTILTASYAWLSYRRTLTVLGTGLGMYALGAVASMLVLVGQLVAYLGWQGLWTDIYVTYVARNAAEDPELLRAIRDFYVSRHVAFWYNFVDSSGLRTPTAFVSSVFINAFQVFTPLMTLLVFVVVAGALLGRTRATAPRWFGHSRVWRWARVSLGAYAGRTRVRTKPPAANALGGGMGGAFVWKTRAFTLRVAASIEIPEQPRLATTVFTRFTHHTRVARFARAMFAGRVRRLGGLVLLWLPLEMLLAVVLRDHAFDGVPPVAVGPMWWTGGFGTLAAMAGAAALSILLEQTTGQRRFVRIAWRRLLLTSIVLFSVAYAVVHQSVLYLQATSALWSKTIEGQLPDVVSRAAVVGAATFAATLVLLGTRRVVGQRATSDFMAGMRYVGCALLAYAGAYLLVPGYVYSGYLVRSAPLTVFFTDALIGAAGYVVVCATLRTAHRLRAIVRAIQVRPSRFAQAASVLGSVASFAIVGGLFIYLVVFWATLQRSYVQLLPPTHFAFLKTLSQPPYLGASFVVNQYSAPVAAYSDQWAYYDPKISTGQVTLTETGYQLEQDFQTYLWLADRSQNAAYQQPEYYVCMIPQTLDSVLYRFQPAKGIGANSECGRLGLVQLARGQRTGPLTPQVAQQDASGQDYWAVLKLDWDYPPYLARGASSASDARVELVTRVSQNGTTLDVHYTFAQQDGRPEQASIVRVYRQNPDSGALCLLEQADQAADLSPLPAGFEGNVRASVTPRTLTKTGQEYFSAVVQIGNPLGGMPDSCP